MEINWIELENKGDERGALIIAESQKNIPFEIKRVYCLYAMDSNPRGFHAHKKLQQVMLCLAGCCNVLLDDGSTKKNIAMNSNEQRLCIDPMIWHEMHAFSRDCVLLVLASEWYDEKDYIRDYQEFKNELEVQI